MCKGEFNLNFNPTPNFSPLNRGVGGVLNSKLIEVSDAFFNNEYFEYDEFIQCTMHPRVQRIKTNAECSHSIPFVAACGIRDIHLLAAW